MTRRSDLGWGIWEGFLEACWLSYKGGRETAETEWHSRVLSGKDNAGWGRLGRDMGCVRNKVTGSWSPESKRQ